MTTYLHAKPAGTPTWIDLMAPDVDTARSFYKAVFGWEYDISGPEYGGYTTARVGDRMTVGIMGNQPGAPPMPAAWSLYFASDDIETDVANAQKLGAKIVSPPMAAGDFGTMAMCEDPTGAMFSFWKAGTHVGSQVGEEPGSAAWYELYSPQAQHARDFYAALLGATADVMPGGMEYYVLKHGQQELCGIMQIDPSWGNFAPQWTIYFLVANIEEAAATITQHGGKMLSSIDDSPFGRLAAVADPNGATFKIIEDQAR